MKYSIRYCNAERANIDNGLFVEIEALFKVLAIWKLKWKTPYKIKIMSALRSGPSHTGWFTFPGFYSDMVRRMPDGATFVEIGVFRGDSLTYFLGEMSKAGKKFTVYAIDLFPDGLRKEFDGKMKPLQNYFSTIESDSAKAASQFVDKSIDAVFIDAAHDYQSVCNDIIAWLPKVKDGGVLSGHDYNDTWPEVKRAVHDTLTDVELKYAPESVWMIVKKAT